METKTCNRCGETKVLGAFHRKRDNRDGLFAQCKDCRKSYTKTYYARPEVKARQAEWQRAWNVANWDERREYKRNYDEAHREEHRAYQVANPHAFWESSYRFRARRFGFEPVVESFTRDELIASYGDSCVHCCGPFEELDHFPLPVSKGGHHTLNNCRPSCADCNRRSWRDDALNESRHDAILEA